MIFMLAVVLVLLGGIFGRWAYKGYKMGQAMAGQKPPPVTVSAQAAREETWQPVINAVGSLAPVQGVTVGAELPGKIVKIAFESGAAVLAGDVLVEQDVSTEETQLRSAEASVALARLNLDRATELHEKNTNSQADLDANAAQFKQATAQADNIRAVINKKTIRAPFAGRLGLRLVNLGQILKEGESIVTLQAVDPLYVNFTLTQQDFPHVTVGQAVQVKVDAYPEAVFTGSINALDSRLDDATRSVRVQTALANADGRLRAGMFANVAVLLPQQEKVVTLPQTAITYNPYGNVVYVIEEGPGPKAQATLTVRQQFVKLGSTRGSQIAILTGVKPGEQVVTSGQLKLRNGVAVRIDNQVPAADNPAPVPPNT